MSDSNDCDFVYLAEAPEVDATAEHFLWEETMVAERDRRDERDAGPVRQVRRLLARTRRALKRHTRRDKVADLSNKYFAAGPVVDIG